MAHHQRRVAGRRQAHRRPARGQMRDDLVGSGCNVDYLPSSAGQNSRSGLRSPKAGAAGANHAGGTLFDQYRSTLDQRERWLRAF